MIVHTLAARASGSAAFQAIPRYSRSTPSWSTRSAGTYCYQRAASSSSRVPSDPSAAPGRAQATAQRPRSGTIGATPASVPAAGKAAPSAPASASRRKLTPTAKAKAQASASRALREQIQATMGTQKASSVGDALRTASAAPSARQAAISASLDQESAVALAAIEADAQEQGSPAETVLSPIRRLRDVMAYATAEEYDFDALLASGRLPNNWQLIEEGNVIYIPHWPSRRSSLGTKEEASQLLPAVDGTVQPTAPSLSTSVHGGEAFIFRSGSYVTWGMSSEQSRKFLRAVIRGRESKDRAIPAVERNPYHAIGDEGMEFIMAEDQITRIVGDIIVLGRAPQSEEEEIEGNYTDDPPSSEAQAEDPDWTPLLARVAFSQGLCRSARLSVQEAALSAYLEEVSTVPGRLEAEGKVPLPRRQVIRKMGTLLKLRQSANLDTENFLDDPEMYWDNALLENHYDSICLALDIESRFNAYNEKLDHGENLLGVLRALLTEASTHRMELIIIYLIAFEVCLALISHEYIPSPGAVWNTVTDVVCSVMGLEPATAAEAPAAPFSTVSDADASAGATSGNSAPSGLTSLKNLFFGAGGDVAPHSQATSGPRHV